MSLRKGKSIPEHHSSSSPDGEREKFTVKKTSSNKSSRRKSSSEEIKKVQIHISNTVLTINLEKDQTNSEHYSLSSFSEGKFKNFLTSSTKEVSLVYPEWLNSKQRDKYTSGLKNYLHAAQNSLVNQNTLTEEDYYYMAVVAYNYQDTTPLLRLDKNPKFSDKYYWLYLSHDDIFYPTMEVEMYRRRTITSIPLLNLKDRPLQYIEGNKQNMLMQYFVKEIETFPHRRIFYAKGYFLPIYAKASKENDCYLMNTNLGNIDKNLDNYSITTVNLCKAILKVGGIIAGGFANSIVNPVYGIHLLEPNIMLYNRINENEDEAFNTHEGNFGLLSGSCSLKQERNHFGGSTITISGFYDCCRVYFARYSDRAHIEKEIIAILDEDKELYAYYDLESELERLKDHILIKDGNLYQIVPHYTGDVDIFLTGDDYLIKNEIIINILLNATNNSSSQVQISEFATTFTVDKYTPKFQVIKRVYSKVEEILAGFDLDASRVALIFSQGEKEVVFLESYANAVEMGINPVVPSRQSETFNLRLVKYYSKGFRVYLPGNVLTRFKLTEWKDESKNHTCNELIAQRGAIFHKWKQLPWSDYEDKEDKELLNEELSEYIAEMKRRAKDIKHGIILPEMKDTLRLAKFVVKLANCNLASFTDRDDKFLHFRSLYRGIVRYITSLFWRYSDPGSQFTGSFNPTQLDYFLGRNKHIKVQIAPENKLVTPLKEIFPIVVVNIIVEYSNENIQNIHSNLLYFQQFVISGENSPDSMNKLLVQFNGGETLTPQTKSNLTYNSLYWMITAFEDDNNVYCGEEYFIPEEDEE